MHHMRNISQLLLLCLVVQWSAAATIAQDDFEREPVNYSKAAVHDRVARLQTQLDQDPSLLKHDSRFGYLQSVLQRLEIDPASQTLVFSQTSFQLRRISPQRPRAIYYNDDVYVGWVQHGDVIEIAAVDSQQGTVFYTLEQEPAEQPRFVRDRGQCMTCHASSRTQTVPGLLVRSVYCDASGRPWFGSGTFTTDHASDFRERWGGWYVSGDHGAMRHMGNVLATNRKAPEQIDREKGANVTDLNSIVKVEPYLRQTSDIVSLMVLEHQTQMQNRITFANFETRQAIHYDGVMNKALERPADYISDTTRRRIKSAAKRLVNYMLFKDEFPLASPVTGDEDYQRQFAARAIRDKQGRSLRDFDLKTRIFKYPCSYLIYSDSFQQLPAAVKQEVLTQLRTALVGESTAAHLTAEQRQSIAAILTETVPEFAQTELDREPVDSR